MTVVECANEDCEALMVATPKSDFCTNCRRRTAAGCAFCHRNIIFGEGPYCSKVCRTRAEDMARRNAEQ